MTGYSYWNKHNFVGLEQLAKTVREDNRCADFADYCDLRARGLRKQAFKSLTSFLDAFDKWSDPRRRDWAHGFMELHLDHPETHQLITHPLREALIATFEEWAGSDSSNPSPCRWLGVLTSSSKHFEDALSRDSGDEYSRYRTANNIIEMAEYACHHIPESFIDELLPWRYAQT